MTVIYVLRRNSGQGGAEKAAERLASQLEERFQVQRMWAGSEYQGHFIPGSGGPAWWRSWRYTRFIDSLQLKRPGNLLLSLEYGPDCDIYRAGDGVHRLNVLRRYGARKGWIFNPWHWYAPRLERKCLESAKVIVANSDLVKTLLEHEYPHLKSKLTTIYNGFNPLVYRQASQSKSTIRSQLSLPLDGIMLLLCGHGFVRKGLHHAVRLLDELINRRRQKAFLVVAGKGDSNYVKKQIIDAGLVSSIYYVGTVSAVERYYQAADFMVLPTRHDPFSNACLEALACGCPVVTSDQNGVAEVLTKDTGFIMHSDYSQAVFDAAADFIVTCSSSEELVAASVSHLTENSEIEKYITLIEQLSVSNTDKQ